MLSNFSAKAIAAIEHAREEAKRLEFNQVDTDHLLLGLVAESNGVAARTLKQLGVDLRKARVAVEQLSGRGYMRAAVDSLFFAPEVQQAFMDALDIAERTEPVLVDTQDLLLALLKHRTTKAVAVLKRMGLDSEAVYRQLMEVRNTDLANPTPLPSLETVRPGRFSPRLLTSTARRVYDAAHQMAESYGHTIVGSEHLLIALLAVEEGAASAILHGNGLAKVDVEAIAHRIIGRGSGTMRDKLVLSKYGEKVLDLAWIEAKKLDHAQVGTGHVLLGLLQLDAGGALTIMDQLKINLAGLQLDAEQLYLDHPREPEPSIHALALPTE